MGVVAVRIATDGLTKLLFCSGRIAFFLQQTAEFEVRFPESASR